MSNIRKKLLKKTEETSKQTLPTWVNNGSDTTRSLFEAAVAELEAVHANYEQTKSARTKPAKLIITKIAKRANKDKSIISERRQPDLHNWIKKENEKLEVMFNETSKRKPPKTKSMRALKFEITELKKLVKQYEEKELKAIVEQFFDSNLLDDRDKLASEVARFKIENKELRETNAILSRNNMKLLEQLSKFT